MEDRGWGMARRRPRDARSDIVPAAIFLFEGATISVLAHLRLRLTRSLLDANERLERRVAERTAQLEQLNAQLQEQIAERRRAAQAAEALNARLQVSNRELQD